MDKKEILKERFKSAISSAVKVIADNSDIEIVKLREVIEKQIIAYREIHEHSEDCFIKKWPHKCKFNAWYVKLLKQGHQKSHMHAQTYTKSHECMHIHIRKVTYACAPGRFR